MRQSSAARSATALVRRVGFVAAVTALATVLLAPAALARGTEGRRPAGVGLAGVGLPRVDHVDAEEIVNEARGRVDHAPGLLKCPSCVPKKVEETLTELKGTVDDVANGALEEADKIVSKLPQAVQEAYHAVLGTGVSRPTPADPASPRSPIDSSNDDRRNPKPDYGTGSASGSHARPSSVYRSMAGTTADAMTETSSIFPADSSPPRRPDPLDIARKLAFPFLLVMLVGAFLLGQNRLDRKDPKLLLAPLTPNQELLSFQ